jgi:hypothetical protein
MAGNPFAAAMETPDAAPHHKAQGTRKIGPTQKHQVAHKGRKPVEMKRSHGARKSAVGRDTRMGNVNPPLPAGRNDVQPAVKGAMRFADQGSGM